MLSQVMDGEPASTTAGVPGGQQPIPIQTGVCLLTPQASSGTPDLATPSSSSTPSTPLVRNLWPSPCFAESTEIYTQSEPFEIKPEGSTYATVPTNAGVSSAAGTLSASVGASGAPAGSSAVPTPSKTAGAMANAVPAIAAAAFGAAAYILA